jgi:hypothetical protein
MDPHSALVPFGRCTSPQAGTFSDTEPAMQAIHRLRQHNVKHVDPGEESQGRISMRVRGMDKKSEATTPIHVQRPDPNPNPSPLRLVSGSDYEKFENILTNDVAKGTLDGE